MKKRISLLMAFSLIIICFAPLFQVSATNSYNSIGFSDVTMEAGDSPLFLETSDEIKESKYVLVSMNVKGYATRVANTCIASGIGIATKGGTTINDMYGFLMAMDHPSYEYFISINDGNSDGFDPNNWYYYAQNGNHHTDSSIKGLLSENGLNVKIVRLDRTVIILVQYSGMWKQIGYLVLPNGKQTEINFFNIGNKTKYSNITVQTNKEDVMNALSDITIETDTEYTETQYMLGDSNWSVEMKVTDKTPAINEVGTVARLTSLTGKANDPRKEYLALEYQADMYRSLHYAQRSASNETFWDTVNKFDDKYVDALKNDGLFIKFVRSADKLYLLFSTDGVDYNIIENVSSNNLEVDPGIISIDLAMEYNYDNVTVKVGDDAICNSLLNNTIMEAGAAPVLTVPSSNVLNADYFVASMNVKGYATRVANTCIASGIGIATKGGTTINDMYGFLMAMDHPSYEYFISINDGNSDGFDPNNWYYYAQNGNHHTDSSIKGLLSENGLNVKLVRMNRTVILLAEYNHIWKQIGYLVLPESAKNTLCFFNLNNRTKYSNITVQTDKEDVMNALSDITIETDTEYTETQYMLGDSNWSVEMKVTDKTPAINEVGTVARLTSLTGKANDPRKEYLALEYQADMYRSLHYAQRSASNETFWDTVNKFDDKYVDALKNDGLFIKFVRKNEYLYLMFSLDGYKYNFVERVQSSNLPEDPGLISLDLSEQYVYEKVSIETANNSELFNTAISSFSTMGDVDGNGSRTIVDLVRLKKCISGAAEGVITDLNDDGYVNSLDLSLLRKVLLGITPVMYYVGTDLYTMQYYKPGEAIMAPESPTKDGRTFSEWTELPEFAADSIIKVYGCYKKKTN